MKKIKPADGNKTFCMAPWTHTYLSPQTERRMCCASREPAQSFKQYIDTGNSSKTYNPLTLEEHWNSEHMRSVRKRMLQGKKLPECEVCNDKLLNTDVYKSYWNHLFAHLIDKAFTDTKEDGSTTMPVISYDYRFNNLCNFKCRMCGSMLSSSWESEQRKHKDWSISSSPWMEPKLREQIKSFQDTQVVKEFMHGVENKTIREIYWCGGEPLMWDIHWTAMQRIIDLGFAKEVYVRYNTNLSRTTYKQQNVFDMLKNFQDWQICASLDGTGKIGEYIRDGLDYDLWLNNFKEGKSASTNPRQMRIDYTITMPGLLELKNMFDLSRELDVQILTKVMFTFSNDEIFSPLSLPKNLLHKIVDDALDYIEPKANWKQQSMVDVLHNLKTRQCFVPSLKGKNKQIAIDKIRKKSITEVLANNTELLDWWETKVK
jgi:hypothetical protein|tara:strand:+ start:5089 stop:6378 length:1290 start_codon:yes stop_codon:yes gene_type:complete